MVNYGLAFGMGFGAMESKIVFTIVNLKALALTLMIIKGLTHCGVLISISKVNYALANGMVFKGY